jgi:hypothetical protein
MIARAIARGLEVRQLSDDAILDDDRDATAVAPA